HGVPTGIGEDVVDAVAEDAMGADGRVAAQPEDLGGEQWTYLGGCRRGIQVSNQNERPLCLPEPLDEGVGLQPACRPSPPAPGRQMGDVEVQLEAGQADVRAQERPRLAGGGEMEDLGVVDLTAGQDRVAEGAAAGLEAGAEGDAQAGELADGRGLVLPARLPAAAVDLLEPYHVGLQFVDDARDAVEIAAVEEVGLAVDVVGEDAECRHRLLSHAKDVPGVRALTRSSALPIRRSATRASISRGFGKPHSTRAKAQPALRAVSASMRVSPTSSTRSAGTPRRAARRRRPAGSGLRLGRLSPPRTSRKKPSRPNPRSTIRDSSSPLLL